MKKMLFAIWGLIMIVSSVSSISADNLTPPDDYKGPIAEAPKYEVGEKWVFNDLTTKNQYSEEIVEVSDDKIKVLIEGNSDLCEGITERDKNFTVISPLKNQDGVTKCYPNRKYLDFPLWVGKKWKFTAEGLTVIGKNICRRLNFIEVISYEDIKVGNFVFKAFKIRQRQTGFDTQETWTRYYWYVTEIKSIVKWDRGDGWNDVELKSYILNSGNNSNLLTSNENTGVSSPVQAEKPPVSIAKNDTTPPKIIITEPAIERTIKRIKEDKIMVRGIATDDSGVHRILINGVKADLLENDRFEAEIMLKIGDNRIIVEATDIKNNTGSQQFMIKREKDDIVSNENAYRPKEKRIALVIGNDKYKDAPLRNPVNDADDMDKLLSQLGFQVKKHINVNQKDMEDAVNDFFRTIQNGDVALFYFSGHGCQTNNENYLIPVNENIQSESDIRYKAVSAGYILGKMEDSRNRINIMILDACRDNPFKGIRTQNKGFTVMYAPRGTFIGYATAPGSVASDGSGRNGTYTKHLLNSFKIKGLLIEQTFKKVMVDVDNETNGKQIPWISSSLGHDFYLNP